MSLLNFILDIFMIGLSEPSVRGNGYPVKPGGQSNQSNPGGDNNCCTTCYEVYNDCCGLRPCLESISGCIFQIYLNLVNCVCKTLENLCGCCPFCRN